jgi:hypothetical protein
MDTKGISTITAVSSPQIPSSPTAFLGHTLQEIRDWFDENITQPLPERYARRFLVLDDQTVEDDIFVCTNESGEIRSLRCTFDVVIRNFYEFRESVDDNMGYFIKSGATMTKENMHYR